MRTVSGVPVAVALGLNQESSWGFVEGSRRCSWNWMNQGQRITRDNLSLRLPPDHETGRHGS